MKKLVLSLAAVLFAVALWPLHALAAAYPDRPITVIVPYTPGGNVDMLARGIAPAIEEELGVKLIITPTPGAGGTVGTMKMIQSRPDGYTLLIGNQTTLSMKPFLQKTRFKLGGAPPICGIALPIHILGTSDSKRFPSLEAFSAEARKNPEQVSVAILGRGGFHEVLAIEVMRELGIKLKMVPFNSGPEQVAALRGGHVDSIITDNYNTEISILASFNNDYKDTYPDAKSFSELGYPNLGKLFNIYSFYAPLGTPQEVVDTFAAAVKKAITSEQFLAVSKNLHIPAEYLTAEDLRKQIESDIAIMQDLKKSGLLD